MSHLSTVGKERIGKHDQKQNGQNKNENKTINGTERNLLGRVDHSALNLQTQHVMISLSLTDRCKLVLGFLL